MATIKKAVKKAIAKKVMSKMAPMMKHGGTLSPSKNSVSKNISNLNKAKDGKSLGMKSVKAGYDDNPGVTRADIISAAKMNSGEAKNGKKMMKMGGKMAKQAAIAIAMKKEGKTPKKMNYGGAAASMVPTSMKAGGKMKKANYGSSMMMKKGGKMMMGGKCKNGC
jgi:hypothetical protein